MKPNFVGVKLSDDHLAKLDQLAVATNCTRTAVIEMMIMAATPVSAPRIALGELVKTKTVAQSLAGHDGFSN